MTKDRRLGVYKSQAGAKTVTLHQSRCTSPFLPCRDVEKASGIFSYVGVPSSTGPTTKPTQNTFRDSPGNAFPIRITVPAIGELTLSKTAWSTEFVLVLGARRLGDQFMPIRHVVWRLESERDFSSGAFPTGIPKVSQVTAGPGAPSGLAIESAMASRTCRLLTRSIERSPKDPQVCRPRVVCVLTICLTRNSGLKRSVQNDRKRGYELYKALQDNGGRRVDPKGWRPYRGVTPLFGPWMATERPWKAAAPG